MSVGKDYLQYTVPLAREEGRAKHGGYDDVDPVLGRLVSFWGELLRRPDSQLHEWLASHAAAFSSYTKGGEHQLTWKDLHLEYETLLETHLDEFVAAEGLSVSELFKRLKVAAADDHAERVISMILAATDYDVFVNLMAKQVARSEAKLDDRPAPPAASRSDALSPTDAAATHRPTRRRPRRRSFGQVKPT